jgi:hypothetical protein
MHATWKYKPTQPNTQLIFQAYGDAFAKAMIASLRSCVINAGVITGGTSVPGGPVVGATLSFSPGSLQAPMQLSLESVFVPPSFPGGSYTPWLKAFTKCLSASTQQAFSQWTTTWLLAGSVVAGGGISAWIPPIPPSPAYPGPWSGGTITSPCGFMAPGFGSNPSLAMKTLDSSFVDKARQTRVVVEKHNVPLVNTKEGEHLARTVASGLASGFETAIASVLVIDKSFLGAGTAVPPTGSIIGGTISNCVLDA